MMTSIACRVCGDTHPYDLDSCPLDISVIMSYHALSRMSEEHD